MVAIFATAFGRRGCVAIKYAKESQTDGGCASSLRPAAARFGLVCRDARLDGAAWQHCLVIGHTQPSPRWPALPPDTLASGSRQPDAPSAEGVALTACT